MKLFSLFIASTTLYSTVYSLQEYCSSDYKPLSDKAYQLDLSKLNNEFTLFQNETKSPATQSIQTVLNICNNLNLADDDKDNCKKGAYICQRTIFYKGDQEFVAEILPIAGDFEKNKLGPEFSPLDTKQDPTQSGFKYNLILNGDKYLDVKQSAVITLECDTSQKRGETPKDPVILSYHNNALNIEWKTVYACATKQDEKEPTPDDGGGGDNKDKDDTEKEGDQVEQPVHEEKGGMSGIAIFFTTILVAGIVYFIGGAVYNYKVYNARGLDLVPHREFWFDLPYLVRDLIAHITDSVGSSRRRGNNGYVSV